MDVVCSCNASEFVCVCLCVDHYSYLDLAKALQSANCCSSYGPIAVVDDGCLLTGSPLTFDSITEVAEEALDLVRTFARSSSSPSSSSSSATATEGNVVTLCLAGWSYGGVVAATVAGMLGKRFHSDVDVSALYLFDSPVREPLAAAARADDADDAAAAVRGAGAGGGDGDGDGKAAMMERAHVHFAACTALLKKHYANEEPLLRRTLRCPVVDVRPQENVYDCGEAAARELTHGVYRRAYVPGTHWTMLFGDNAAAVAEVMMPSP